MIKSSRGGFQWRNWDMKSGYKPTQWQPKVSAPLCAYCNKAVYPAEEVIGGGQKFHRFCLKCATCDASLNISNMNEYEKKIYCIPCFRQQFGLRGVNRGLHRSLSVNLHSPPTSPDANKTFHSERKTSIDSSQSRSSSDDEIRSSSSYLHKVTFINQVTINNVKSRSSSSIKMLPIPGNICPRCSKIVYLAEEIRAAGKSFHKRCYTCANCKAGLNGGRYSEHNGELYDNNCYQRLFGPKGILLIRN